MRIDVLIPAIEKDLSTLGAVVDGVRAQVKHSIGRILIVAPRKPRLLAFCRRKGCTFVDENTVLPLTKKGVVYRSQTWERSGWLFQQLLKLGGDRICTADYFLVIDADTVLIAPHRFRKDGKTVFYTRNWSQPEYFRTYRRLMGHPRPARVSFVTHYMLFERAALARMKREIEARHGLPWYRAVLKSMDRKRPFAFSEFETYGNYMYRTDRSGMILRPARNRSLNTSPEALPPERRKALAKRCRSLSFHKRKDYSRKKE
nr:DUF6492 family protein [Paenibacillus sp. YX.27]